MKEILKFLPEEINTGIIVISVIILWKVITFILSLIKKKKEAQKSFEKEVLQKERQRSKFDSRLTKVEDEVVNIRKDFDRKNIENKEDFLILSRKIDKILDILIKPIK